ncbi:hypothetical protein IWQ62_001064 [Dispira parvispora]|uniref:Carrier domain-containing protein n=1 Tax=Dispira parvispora TaxID=1520584 RepID=A0A9W8AYU9_9FUNG|nr:hypothetical protein IWQ62_001064 [Dispira parvispora]
MWNLGEDAKHVTNGTYGNHPVAFQCTLPCDESFWTVLWALLWRHCGGEQAEVPLVFEWARVVQNDWSVHPVVMTMDSQATVNDLMMAGIRQRKLQIRENMPSYVDTIVAVLEDREVKKVNRLSAIEKFMAQWNVALAVIVIPNNESTQHRAYFIYDPVQVTPDDLTHLTHQFLRLVEYFHRHGLNVTLASALQFLGEPLPTLSLPCSSPPSVSRGLVKQEASPEQTRIWLAGQDHGHHFYHLIVFCLKKPVCKFRIQSAVQRLTQAFPVLGSLSVDYENQVFQAVGKNGSTTPCLAVIDEALFGTPEQLRLFLHDIHHLDSHDHPLFSVAGLMTGKKDYVEWISVYTHRVLADQIQFYRWVGQLWDLITNLSAIPLVPVDVTDGTSGLDPSEYWQVHFAEHSSDMGLPWDYTFPVSPTYCASRYRHTVPNTITSRLPHLMKSLEMNRLELLQGFLALFLLRVVSQTHVALFSQIDQNSRIPWMAQAVEKVSIADMLCSMTEGYRQSSQYDWSGFDFPHAPKVCTMVLPMQPGFVLDFGKPYASVPLLLTWLYEEGGTGLELVIDYQSEVLQLSTVERLVQNLLFFTTESGTDLAQDWRKVPIVHPSEETLLLDSFAYSGHHHVTNENIPKGVLSMFAHHVAHHPNIIAVECGDHRETYQSLSDKVWHLAVHLHSLGIQRQERVAVIVESNAYTTMTILALWTLRAVYVPLDCKLPKERQQYMVETADCVRVLSTATIKPHGWSNLVNISDIVGTDHPVNIGHLSTLTSHQNNQPNDLAYILFTSGTTGKPKGVTINHSNFCNLIAHHHHFTGFSPIGTRFLPALGVAFDPYLYGTILTLSSGWTLVLSPIPSEALDKVDAMVCTPSFLASVYPENCPQLTWIVVGGEHLAKDLVERWGNHCTLFNAYGPTETTVLSHLHPLDPHAARITIGRPYPGYECYVFDDLMQLVPIGTTGEIFIGGAGVSPGYVKRSDLNETRFLPNPLRPGKLYRTGDYGRWLPNGEVECLGRIDDQVKLRGFRIELGEIRGALLNHAGVRDAFVTVVNKKLLVGFVISDAGASVSDKDLLNALETCLPQYMLPHHLIILQDKTAFPLTLNGKIDQHELNKIFQEQRTKRLGMKHRLVSLDTLQESQKVLIAAVANTLQLSIDDRCFSSSLVELGGDSITAIRVSVQCHRQGWEVPVSLLLQEQSLESISQMMSKVETSANKMVDERGSSSTFQPIGCLSADQSASVHHELGNWGWKPGDVQAVYPMLPMQQGMMIATARDPTAYVLQMQVALQGELSANDIAQIIWALVQSHDALRVHFLTNWSEGNITGLQVVKRSHYHEFLHLQWRQLEKESDRDSYALDDIKRGFGELTPMVRFGIQSVTTNLHWLLITAHHAVMDGWSVGLLLHSLSHHVDRILSPTAKATLLSPLFGDYSWYAHRLCLHPPETDKTYWQEYLANIDSATIVSLPGDPNGVDNVQEAEHILYRGITELSDKLKIHGITLHTIIQTAWALTLSHYTGGRTDLIFGQVFSGRGGTCYANIDDVVGCLVNTLPVRIQLSAEHSVMDLLQYVQRRHHSMLRFQHCHITRVNQWMDKSKINLHELFNSLLVYQNLPSVRGQQEGLRLIDMTFSRSSEFALTTMVEHHGDHLVVRIGHRPRMFHTKYVDLMSKYMATCFHRLVASLMENRGGTPALSHFGNGCDASRKLYIPVPLTTTPPPNDSLTLCVHDILQWETQTIGDRVAIEYGNDTRWSYVELYQRSLYIAYGLLARGVNREEPVGLVVNRQPSAIAAMFGVLMAGAAYVLVNIDVSQDDILFIMQDCNVQFVMTNTGIVLDGVQVLDIDTLMDQPVIESPLPKVKPEDLFHIIYTWNTAGKLEGARKNHHAVASFVQQAKDKLGLVPGLRMMQSVPLTSDYSTMEIFGGLCNGVTLVYRADIFDNLAKVDTILLSPSLLTTVDLTCYTNITRVLVGEEGLSPEVVEKWSKHARVYNNYRLPENFQTRATETRIKVQGRWVEPDEIKAALLSILR